MNQNQSDYDQKRAGYFQSRRVEMLEFVPITANKIVEFGCGAGMFSEQIKERQNACVYGVDIMSEPLILARQKLDQVFQRDIENGLDFLRGEKFDCAIFIDVLEHLKSPWKVLSDLRNYLVEGGVVVASIPNVRHYEVIKSLILRKRFEYQDEGVMDRTHLRFFAKDDIIDLFQDCSYKVTKITGVQGGFPWKFGLLNKLFFDALSDMQFKQFGITAIVQ